ncbi:hypothetical protein BEN71_12315 [Acinetobacter wuhouensis]|nr:hypothetical protein BEN71_12315 [Acinetobacter wuhouensis]
MMIFFSELYVGFYLNPPLAEHVPHLFQRRGLLITGNYFSYKKFPLFFKDEQQRCARGEIFMNLFNNFI